jgi:IS5 family transposase
VLSRLVRRATPLVGEQLAWVRDAVRSRVRTLRRGLHTIQRTARQKGEEAAEHRAVIERKLSDAAQQTVRHARRRREALEEATDLLPRKAQRLREHFDHCVPLVERVIDQATRRVLAGETVPASEKVVSIVAPQTPIIRRHKSGAEVAVGRRVVCGATDGGSICSSQVLRTSGSAQDAVLPAVAQHQTVFGHPPQLLTGERGTHSAGSEAAAHAAGGRDVVIPWSGTRSTRQRAHEKERRWRQLDRWPAGSDGRIDSLPRD